MFMLHLQLDGLDVSLQLAGFCAYNSPFPAFVCLFRVPGTFLRALSA